jgi:hypothetical protein
MEDAGNASPGGAGAGRGVLRAPYTLEYTYRRSVGPVIGRFLAGLREGRIEGVRSASGKVIVPPVEYDPDTGEAVTEFVPVAEIGTVTTWAWMREQRPKNPLGRPFAWALVKLDGADTAFLHAVDAGDPSKMKTGMRVRIRWSPQRDGSIRDITCFELVDDGGLTRPSGALPPPKPPGPEGS